MEDWLLVGGPANGKIVHVKGGVTVLWQDDNGKVFEYVGRSYGLDGAVYRIGVLAEPDDSQLEFIEDKLRSLNTAP